MGTWYEENKKIKEIKESRVIRTSKSGTPYLHFDEALYLQKEKIKRPRYTGDFLDWFFEDPVGNALINSMIGFPFWFPWIFLKILWGILTFFFGPVFLTYIYRKKAYQIYLDECKAFKMELQNQHKKEELEELDKFSLSYSSAKK